MSQSLQVNKKKKHKCNEISAMLAKSRKKTRKNNAVRNESQAASVSDSMLNFLVPESTEHVSKKHFREPKESFPKRRNASSQKN